MSPKLLTNTSPLLLDAGLGRELRFRGMEIPNIIWSAGTLMTDPEVVRQMYGIQNM